MFWIKACPRCRGDLYEGRDIYGNYVSCLQCARCLTIEEESQLLSQTPAPDLLPAKTGPERQAA